MARIVVVGEGMLELARAPATDGWRLGYGGDTLNTAIHLARYGHDVRYVTALGLDPFSDELAAAWAADGLDTGLIARDPHRVPGLYAIRVDGEGERSFTYWRGDSAARGMFDLLDGRALAAAIGSADLLAYSLITLAILPPAGRAAMLALAGQARAAGARVAFDGNYRARLWPDGGAAAMRDAAAAAADIGLPTLEDEEGIAGGALTPGAVAESWGAQGAAETVVKLGAEGCLVEGVVVSPPHRLRPVDTSGAGDAFNAGYLHGRLAGEAPATAALTGHALAGWVLMHPGAVPPRSGDAPY